LVIIRKAETMDIDRIAEMAVDFENYLISLDDTLVDEPFPLERYRQVLAQGFGDDKHNLYIAEEDGIIVGFADYWVYPEFLHGGLSGYLHNIYIDQEWRGNGIGTSFVEHILKDAKEKGAVAMHVPVKPANRKALDFYRKLGIVIEFALLETRLDGT
jgi:ribosomal protein S18 acetylase RimI-like enzyme